MEQANKKESRLPILRQRLNDLLGDMSTTDFAKKVGISRQTMGFYLNGDRIPDAATLHQICTACDISADWLLGLTDDPTRQPSAVDELGLAPETIQKIKRSKNEHIKFDEALLGEDAQIADFNTCTSIHGAVNLLLNATLDTPIYTMLALLARRINTLMSTTIPNELAAHEELINRMGPVADDYSVSAKLTCALFDQYPELAGMFRITFGEESLRLDIDDICNIFRKHVEEISGYRYFMHNRKL